MFIFIFYPVYLKRQLIFFKCLNTTVLKKNIKICTVYYKNIQK